MKPNKNKKKILFRINRIKRLGHFENDFSKYGINKRDLTKGSVKIGAKLSISSKDGTISFKLDIKYYLKKEKKDYNLFGIETQHDFIVKSFKTTFLISNKNEVDIPDSFLVSLLSISIDSTRGMIAVTNTTPDYEGIILPLVNSSELLNSIIRKSKTAKNNS